MSFPSQSASPAPYTVSFLWLCWCFFLARDILPHLQSKDVYVALKSISSLPFSLSLFSPFHMCMFCLSNNSSLKVNYFFSNLSPQQNVVQKNEIWTSGHQTWPTSRITWELFKKIYGIKISGCKVQGSAFLKSHRK